MCSGCSIPSDVVCHHLGIYLWRGCGALYPPLERCVPELGALLRRNSTAHAVGPYLWLFTAANLYKHPSHLDAAAVLQQLGDALAAAEAESLDQQLRRLQGIPDAASSLLITSRQLQWKCYHAAHENVVSSRMAAVRNDEVSQGTAAEILQIQAHCATRMMELEPRNPCSLDAAALLAESGSATFFQLIQRAYEEAAPLPDGV